MRELDLHGSWEREVLRSFGRVLDDEGVDSDTLLRRTNEEYHITIGRDVDGARNPAGPFLVVDLHGDCVSTNSCIL